MAKKTVSQEDLAKEILDVMRERHLDCIKGSGAGRDGDDIYLSSTLEATDFEIDDEEVETYNDEEAPRWAGIVHADNRWILEVNLDKLAADEGQEAGSLVMAIADAAANACDWLEDKLEE